MNTQENRIKKKLKQIFWMIVASIGLLLFVIAIIRFLFIGTSHPAVETSFLEVINKI